jgi:hypothetical protein
MSEPKGAASEVSDLLDLLKRYVLQETLGPFKTMGRSLGFGAAAAMTLGIGGVFALIGVLRVLETETGTLFGGDLSWAPYGLTIVAGLLVIGLAAALLLRTPRSERARRSGSAALAAHREEAT